MSALKATTSLIFVQVFSRLSTFIINQASLRYLSPALLGASTQLELFSTTVLTFARDTLRVALAREGYDPNLQGVVNAAHLPVLLGIPLALGFKVLYELTGLPDVPDMGQAVNWVAIASIVEMLAEPAFALVQVKGEYGIRASAETTATIARCIATFASVVYADSQGQKPSVMPFAYGQMAYALGILVVYLLQIGPTIRASKVSWFPKGVEVSKNSKDTYFLGFVSNALMWLAFTLSAQTIIKQLLGEGDHVVMAMFASLEDQGAYDLAHNYGSLVARMMLQPIEEGCRGLFGRLCAGAEEESGEAKRKGKSSKAVANNQVKRDTGKENLRQAKSTLSIVMRLYSIFTLICLSIGPTIAPLLLRLIAGAKWSDSKPAADASSSAGSVLSTYCYLLPLMAFNGILEAFVSAVATPAQLYQQSIVMSIFTAAFGAASFLFLGYFHWGAHGLVLAQCFAMGLRIIWSWWFSDGWFNKRGLSLDYQNFLPSPMSIAVAAVTAVAIMQEYSLPILNGLVKSLPSTLQSRLDLSLTEQLIVKGGTSVLAAVGFLVTERSFWMEQYKMFSSTTEEQGPREKKQQ